MDDIDAAFDDAYRTNRIEAGDDPSTLPNPYARPSLTAAASSAKDSKSTDTGGGFMVDDDGSNAEYGGGGFMVDDTEDAAGGGGGGGGFIVDDEEEASGGGFMPEDEDEEPSDNDAASSSGAAKATRPTTIPLSAIPEALANLGLDSADPSVLSLFAETAYVPSSASRRRLAPGAKPEKVVGRQEFQQVASILLDEMQTRGSSSSKSGKRKVQDEDEEEEQSEHSSRRRPTRRAAVQGRRKAAEIVDWAEDDDVGGGGFVVDPEADDSEEDFEVSRQRRRRTKPSSLDTGSDLTSDGEDDLEASSSRRRRRRAAASPSPSPTDSDTQRTPSKPRRKRASPSFTPTIRSTTHLNPLQRDTATDLYSLLLDRLPPSTFPAAQRRLGISELTTILSAIGEKIPPKEIEEMLEEASKLFAPAASGERPSREALRGVAAAQGISGASVGLDEFAGVLVHNRLL